MRKYSLMNLKQKRLQQFSLSALILAAFFALFSLFHSAAYAVMPASHMHSSTAQHPETATACIQQCIGLNQNDQQLQKQEDENKDPAIEPFVLLLAAATIGYYLLLPKLSEFLRRAYKIPIYKQVSCYRI